MFQLLKLNKYITNTDYMAKADYNLPPFNNNKIAEDITNEINPTYLGSCLLRKMGRVGKLNHLTGIAKAIERWLYIRENAENFGGMLKTPTSFLMEYWDGKAKDCTGFDTVDPNAIDRRIVFRIDGTGNNRCVKASELTQVLPGGGFNVAPLKIATSSVAARSGGHSSSCLFFAILGLILYDDSLNGKQVQTIRGHFENLLQEFNASYNAITDTMVQYMRVLENDLYAIATYNADTELDELFEAFSVSAYTSVNGADMALEGVNCAVGNVQATRLASGLGTKATGKTKSTIKPKTVKEVADEGEFVLDASRVLNQEEELLVPHLDDMVPSQEILLKARLIKESTLMPKPFRNVLWIGETGTGKSTAARILAQLMHLPYAFITINPDTIVSDLYVNVLPNANAGKIDKEMVEMMERAVLDTDEAYFDLTGIRKTNVKPADVIREVLQKKPTGDFMYVESALVKAYRYGWVVELQEVNYAMKPGVLGGINAALDDIGIIELPTGEIVKRHPNTIVVMTANDGYEGTRKINQAVKSRMTLKGHMELPDDDELARRASQNSGFKDLKTIKKMVSVMHGIRRVMDENGETNGSCSVRELQSWCQATEICKDPYEAAMSTIVPSATDDPEVIKDVIEALEKQFAKRMQ